MGLSGNLTAKAGLHPRKRSDGTQQVRVRLTRNRQSVFWDAGFTLPAKHWNPEGIRDKKNWVRLSEKEHLRLNTHLRKMVDSAEAAGMAYPLLPAADLLAALLGAPLAAPEAPDFVAFARQYVEDRARTDKPGTVRFYYYAVKDLLEWRHAQCKPGPSPAFGHLRPLADWVGHTPLPYALLTEQNVRDFHAWLCRKPNVHATTARDRVVKLGTVARLAVKRGQLDDRANPFPDLKLPVPPAKRPPRTPHAADVDAVLGLDLGRKSRASGLAMKRDVWTLQMLALGTRIGDVLQLREQDVRDSRLLFVETKTGKTKSVKRTEAIDAILARYPATGDRLAYVFPLLDHTAWYATEHPTLDHVAQRDEAVRNAINKVNDGLEILCRQAGVVAFTSHSARHYFAALAWDKLKDLLTMQRFFNHSSPTTTMRYLRGIGVDTLDAAADAVWDNG